MSPEERDEKNRVVKLLDLELELAPIRTDIVKLKYGIGVIAVMVASPKLGGPAAPELVKTAFNYAVNSL